MKLQKETRLLLLKIKIKKILIYLSIFSVWCIICFFYFRNDMRRFLESILAPLFGYICCIIMIEVISCFNDFDGRYHNKIKKRRKKIFIMILGYIIGIALMLPAIFPHHSITQQINFFLYYLFPNYSIQEIVYATTYHVYYIGIFLIFLSTMILIDLEGFPNLSIPQCRKKRSITPPTRPTCINHKWYSRPSEPLYHDRHFNAFARYFCVNCGKEKYMCITTGTFVDNIDDF